MRRGLTLLELLLALALVIALGAIALPAMLETSEHKKLSNTADEIEHQLLQTRAHAMVMSAPLEVRFDREAHRIIVCDVLAGRDEQRAFDREVREEGASQREALPVVKRSWAQLAIDEAVSISIEPPENVELAEELGASIDADSIAALRMSRSLEEAFDDRNDEPILTLAFFLPDGSAPIVEPIWLSTEDGRAMRIDIGRWTGLPTVVRDPSLMEQPDETPDDEAEEATPEEDETQAPEEDVDRDAPDPAGDSGDETDEDADAGDGERDDDDEEDESNGGGA